MLHPQHGHDFSHCPGILLIPLSHESLILSSHTPLCWPTLRYPFRIRSKIVEQDFSKAEAMFSPDIALISKYNSPFVSAHSVASSLETIRSVKRSSLFPIKT